MNAPGERVLQVDRASFDPLSGRLQLDGRTTTLRPRTAAVLAHLLHHAGRVVTKDELMAAVWPDAVVTDDSLVQCVKEIRHALGSAGRDWIRTVPRQGYALLVTPTEPPTDDTAALPEAAVPPAVPSTSRPQGLFLAALALVVMLSVLGLALPPAVAPVESAEPSIVVLPIANHTGHAGADMAAEDLTETLASALASIPGLAVIAPATAFTYKGKAVDPRRVGRELGVRYVLEGGLRQGAAQPMLKLRLTDAGTAALLWSEDFEGEGEPLPGEVAARVARSLSLRLAHEEARRVERERPSDPTAADLLARARALLRWASEGGEAIPRGRALLEEALRRDDTLAEAWALLAHTHLSGARFSTTPQQDVQRAAEAAGRALALEPDTALARFVQAWVLYNQRRMAQALDAFDHVLELSPNEPAALAGRGASLVMLGRPQEAVAPIELAIRLSPRDPLIEQWQMFRGVAELHLGHVDGAVSWLSRSVDGNPRGVFNRLFLASALGCAGRVDEARAQMAEFQRLRPGFTLAQFRAREPSDVEPFQRQRERVYEGLRLAGMPEGSATATTATAAARVEPAAAVPRAVPR
jgi:adenylate cyclase